MRTDVVASCRRASTAKFPSVRSHRIYRPCSESEGEGSGSVLVSGLGIGSDWKAPSLSIGGSRKG